jgi:hypothetical protein
VITKNFPRRKGKSETFKSSRTSGKTFPFFEQHFPMSKKRLEQFEDFCKIEGDRKRKKTEAE